MYSVTAFKIFNTNLHFSMIYGPCDIYVHYIYCPICHPTLAAHNGQTVCSISQQSRPWTSSTLASIICYS
ncbi:unnamed protein product [Nezara viridula]|uniref:Uncharacterized protein n=1 Tax=Nezara viridula TaxID=85310 RepID=A0A9P0MPK0_NEZVI|nr:unnamed protein product [Nezara viridula]